MSDEQINWAITEAIGADPHWKCAKDYCNDLNAMHEAEKMLFPYYATVYSNKLAKVTGAEMSDDTDYFCATARQRAEAFLLALGKWSATNKESLTVGATTEESSVDHLRDGTKMMRFQAAIAAMQGHIVHRGFSENGKHVADLSVRYADALIAELENEVQG